jgi:L-lactate dehydrogenase complex protein LldF
VYRRSGGHSYGVTIAGPIGSIINTARNPEEHHSLPFACSLCGSCTDVCPVKIDLHHQLLAWRGVLAAKGLVEKSKLRMMWAAGTVLKRPWLYKTAGWLGRVALRVTPRWLVYNRFNAWGRQRELPQPPKRSFRAWHRSRKKDL